MLRFLPQTEQVKHKSRNMQNRTIDSIRDSIIQINQIDISQDQGDVSALKAEQQGKGA